MYPSFASLPFTFSGFLRAPLVLVFYLQHLVCVQKIVQREHVLHHVPMRPEAGQHGCKQKLVEVLQRYGAVGKRPLSNPPRPLSSKKPDRLKMSA